MVAVHNGEKAMLLNQGCPADSWALPTSNPEDTLVNRLWGLTHTLSSMALGWRQGRIERLKGVRGGVPGPRPLVRSL